MRSQLFVFLLLCFYLPSYAQDSALIHQLLQRIASLQTNNNFPTYISNKKKFAVKTNDNNIFFAALLNYTLAQQRSSLSANNRLIIDSIQQKSSYLYSHFQNKKGRLSYNFWRTDTTFIFPYTWWIPLVKKNTSLPDDLDDTVLSLMAQNADSTRAAEAHAAMQAFISNKKRAKTIHKNYRLYKTYSVWYGKNFPPVYDVCVLCNILCFVQRYHLTWTAADSAALNVIVKAIKNKDYINKPLSVSPYYGSTSLLLYHLARLMSYGKILPLEALQPQLVMMASLQFATSDNLLQKIILSSAIMQWGYAPPPMKLPETEEAITQIENSDFPFFTGNIPSYFAPLYRYVFLQNKWLLFYHYCPAFNDALLLQYLLLKKHIYPN